MSIPNIPIWRLPYSAVQRAVLVTGIFENAVKNSGLDEAQLNTLFEANPGDLGAIWNALIEAGHALQQQPSLTSNGSPSTIGQIIGQRVLPQRQRLSESYQNSREVGNTGSSVSTVSLQQNQPQPTSHRSSQDPAPQQPGLDSQTVNLPPPRRVHVPPKYEHSPTKEMKEARRLPQRRGLPNPKVGQQLGQNLQVTSQPVTPCYPSTGQVPMTYPHPPHRTNGSHRQDDHRSASAIPHVTSPTPNKTPTFSVDPPTAHMEQQSGYTTYQLAMISRANRDNPDFNLQSTIESNEAEQPIQNGPVLPNDRDNHALPLYGTSRNPIDPRVIDELVQSTGLRHKSVSRMLRYTNGDDEAAKEYMTEERVLDDPPHVAREIEHFRNRNTDLGHIKETTIAPFRMSMISPSMALGPPNLRPRARPIASTVQNFGPLDLAQTTPLNSIFHVPTTTWHGQGPFPGPYPQTQHQELPMPAGISSVSRHLLNRPLEIAGPIRMPTPDLLHGRGVYPPTSLSLAVVPRAETANNETAVGVRVDPNPDQEPRGDPSKGDPRRYSQIPRSLRNQSEPAISSSSSEVISYPARSFFRTRPAEAQLAKDTDNELQDSIAKAPELNEKTESVELGKRKQPNDSDNGDVPMSKRAKAALARDAQDVGEAVEDPVAQSRVSKTRKGPSSSALDESDEDYKVRPVRRGNNAVAKDRQPVRKPRGGRGGRGRGKK